MNPFKTINKIKGVKDKMDSSKEKREIRQLEEIKEYFELRGLDKLSENEKEFMELLRQDNESLTRHPVKGSEAEVTVLDMLQIIIEQNNMIIGLLGAIRDKE